MVVLVASLTTPLQVYSGGVHKVFSNPLPVVYGVCVYPEKVI